MKLPLRVAEGISLPLDAVTQTLLLLAKRRAGKSYLSRRLAEQIYKAGVQQVIVDPKGDHWGICYGTGKEKGGGLPFVILGGEHGNLKLEVGAGEIIAKLAVEERVNLVLDLSDFRKGELVQFMTEFLETFYRLKAREEFRTPVMLLVDEADAIAPQKPSGVGKGVWREERMVGAMSDIVRRGGQRGIGTTLITQRSAVLNKDVLTQAQLLIALRTIAPQDLAAVKLWVDVHGTPEQREVLMASLPSLPQGDAWWWSPGWPTDEGIFSRARTLEIETFDSFATPKPGQRLAVPKDRAEVDLGTLEKHMAATVARAKADDPKELRRVSAEKDRRILDLEKQVAGAIVKTGSAKTSAEDRAALREQASTIVALRKALEVAMKFIVQVNAQNFDVPGVDPAEIEKAIAAAVERATQLMESKIAARAKELERLRAQAAKILEALKGVIDSKVSIPIDVTRNEPFSVSATASALRSVPTSRPAPVGPPPEGLSGPEHRVVQGLAKLHAIGVVDVPRSQAALLAGYGHARSKGFTNSVSSLHVKDLIGYGAAGTLALTEGGKALAGAQEPMTTAELHGQIAALLRPVEWKILAAVIASFPDSISREALAQATGYEHLRSKGFTNALSRLSALGLVEYLPGGLVRARAILFLEGEQEALRA